MVKCSPTIDLEEGDAAQVLNMWVDDVKGSLGIGEIKTLKWPEWFLSSPHGRSQPSQRKTQVTHPREHARENTR